MPDNSIHIRYVAVDVYKHSWKGHATNSSKRGVEQIHQATSSLIVGSICVGYVYSARTYTADSDNSSTQICISNITKHMQGCNYGALTKVLQK